MKLRRIFLIILASLFAAYFLFFWSGFTPHSRAPELHIMHTASYGDPRAKANIVGIEPYMTALDYSSGDAFYRKLAGYFNHAAEKGWLKKGTIILLPEHIGSWLVAADQGHRVYKASTTDAAMRPIIASNLFAVLKSLFIFDDDDGLAAAIFRARAKAMSDIQISTFSRLAKAYGVTIVAGSTVMMTPGVYEDVGLTYGHGPIFNTSFTYGPDGRLLDHLSLKVHPIPSEAGFIRKAPLGLQETFTISELTDIKIATLVCADSWFDDTVAQVATSGANILLVPSFLEGTQWDDPWNGYLNDWSNDMPWQEDVGKISEGEAWQKWGFAHRAQKHGIRWGMNVFLKGQFFGLTGSGRAMILENGVLHIGAGGDEGAALYNLWLSPQTVIESN